MLGKLCLGVPPEADRIKEFFLYLIVKKAERSDIHNSSIFNHHSTFHEVSYEGLDCRQLRLLAYTTNRPLTVCFYNLYNWNTTNWSQCGRAVSIVIDEIFQLLPLRGGYVLELYRAPAVDVLPDKLWIFVFIGYRKIIN